MEADLSSSLRSRVSDVLTSPLSMTDAALADAPRASPGHDDVEPNRPRMRTLA